jgi:hypothetical protein
LLLAGVFAALAFWLKYNAGVYLLPVLGLAIVAADGRLSLARVLRPAVWIGAGFLLMGLLFLIYFGTHGALTDLGLATISYNLEYSSETYEGLRGVAGYLIFPLQRAKLDLLWFLGGLGVVALIWRDRRNATAWMAIGWVAAACVSIAVNGARNLPQFFVQANPALAFAAGVGLWPWFRDGRTLARAGLFVLLALGLWKVGDEADPIRLGGLPEAWRNAAFDLDYARGAINRTAYLGRFQQQADTKYVPLSADELTEHVRRTTQPADRIFVFGLAAGVYVNAPRQSASRFFWSRPVVVEFGAGRPGYGSAGLLTDLQHSRPTLIALQKHWDTPAPEAFFLANPPLRGWLDAHYALESDSAEFSVWRRRE